MIFRSVLVVDFIVLMIDFICLEKENDLKVRRVPYCDTNTCVSLKSRTVPYFCWYCEESLFKQLSLICVLATFFFTNFWEMMLISLFKKNLGWLFWIQLRQGFDQQHFFIWVELVRRKNGNYLPLRKIIPWKPESVQLTTEYTQNNSLVFEITMFLVYWQSLPWYEFTIRLRP